MKLDRIKNRVKQATKLRVLQVLFAAGFSALFLDEFLLRLTADYSGANFVVFFRVLDRTDLGCWWLLIASILTVLAFAYAGISISYEAFSVYLHRARSLAFIFLGLSILAIIASLCSPILAVDTIIIVALAKSLLYVYPRYDIFYWVIVTFTVSAHVISGHYTLSSVILSVYLGIIVIRSWRKLWEKNTGESVKVMTSREERLL
jgi:hypothetical protein